MLPLLRTGEAEFLLPRSTVDSLALQETALLERVPVLQAEGVKGLVHLTPA